MSTDGTKMLTSQRRMIAELLLVQAKRCSQIGLFLICILCLDSTSAQGASSSASTDSKGYTIGPIGPSDYIQPDEFINVLRTSQIDKILEATSKIKQMRYQGDVLPLISHLWAERRDLYPGLPWSTVSSDIVRLELANILAQAENNGFIDMDTEPLHKFIRDMLVSQNKYVVMNALSIVYIFDNDEDVITVLSIAKTAKRAIFRMAVFSLSLMCNRRAKQALAELSRSEANSVRKEFIKQRSLKKFARCTP